MAATDESYFRVEPDKDFTSTKQEATFPKVCWESNGFGVCVEDWRNDRLKLGIYVGGVRIATATLTASDPCFKVKEGNDILKVKAEVCADFAKRHVRVKGNVCSFGLCIDFSQIIFEW